MFCPEPQRPLAPIFQLHRPSIYFQLTEVPPFPCIMPARALPLLLKCFQRLSFGIKISASLKLLSLSFCLIPKYNKVLYFGLERMQVYILTRRRFMIVNTLFSPSIDGPRRGNIINDNTINFN